MNEAGPEGEDLWWVQDLTPPVDPPEQAYGWTGFDTGRMRKAFEHMTEVWTAKADELDRKMWRKLAGLDVEPESEPEPISKHPREDTTKSYPTSEPGRRGKKRHRHHR